MPNPSSAAARHPFFDNAILLFSLVAVFWLVEAADYALGRFGPGPGALDQYGIVPRDTSHLSGIAFSPFLHGGFPHLIGNTVPFLALGGLVLLSGRKTFFVVSAIVALLGGLGIWLFAPAGGVHIGASTVIFGYLGFLLLRAWFARDLRWGAIALVAGFFYGGLVLTLFRHQPGISWHGHAFGFAAGVAAAWLLTADRGRQPRKAPVAL